MKTGSNKKATTQNNSKMSRLENFVRQNRPMFDSEEPSPDLWRGIEARLPAKNRRKCMRCGFVRR